MFILFGSYILDTDRRELKRSGELIPVEPQVFDLLVHLVRNRDRVVSKDDLIASVWGGRIVSESTLTSRINAVRKAVGDSGEQQQVVRTIARKGFRWDAFATSGANTRQLSPSSRLRSSSIPASRSLTMVSARHWSSPDKPLKPFRVSKRQFGSVRTTPTWDPFS